ncbi:very short patch repair endonuclease [Zafaria cholistanensis]|uniref:Very short patch repair endonuclease n=1 Tax=Zafaria cholistanensis TaxID=1682741 RepID=A0A5A7NRP9_9MICC|nr:very short patch repair endonuclease [Zafaria cholistanensis]
MADKITPEARSRNMAAVRSTNTKIEVAIRRSLHSRGFRYRVNVKQLPGKPDIVLPRYQAVIMVHGCFWHGHDCPLFRWPKTRQEFWEEKIGGNQARDERVVKQLTEAGWRIATVWECALRGQGGVAGKGHGRPCRVD